MHLNIACALLLLATRSTASLTTTTTTPTLTPTPSLNPTMLSASLSSASAASASASSADLADHLRSGGHDCIFRAQACDWIKSSYGYGAEYCGYAPYRAGQRLGDGSVVVTAASSGRGGCARRAGAGCCRALEREPCKRGEKYLQCFEMPREGESTSGSSA